ncbi:MAG TPA: tRNA lysidine(34) synthetase TilS [Candidatus Acidoferrum sp.]|nr:tRNA lysidine(34) synthetase TilS [Candidatus Acidoferrum sp.]
MTGERAKKGRAEVKERDFFVRRVFVSLKRQEMLRAGDCVAVAVSGGADSVALLLLLLELRKRLGILLSVVHFNHKLRGKASDADEKFVAKLAAKHRLEFHSASTDVGKKAKQERSNLEETARRARYDYFRSLVEAGVCKRVAVAHTADDQAETVLAHLLRGTGLAGLGGIHPVAGSVVRPLLKFRRGELRAFLRAKKQSWREDATNRDTTRMRARIRKKLLPLMEKRFQPAIVEHLSTLAELAREDEEFFDLFVEVQARASAQKYGEGVRIAVGDLLAPLGKEKFNIEDTENAEEKETARALSKRLVRRIVESIKSRAGQLGARHFEAMLELAHHGHNGSSLTLPGGVEVRRERDALLFLPTEEATEEVVRNKPREYEYAIDLTSGAAVVSVPELSCVFRLRVIDWPCKRGETSKDRMVLDRDRLRSPVVLRNWRPGDRMRLLGHSSPQKLKRLLNEQHISRWERNGWPVLASGGVLAWARGFPVTAEFAADERTRAGVVIAEEQH